MQKDSHMKTVMILGAGVTRAAGQRKSMKLRPPLDADFFEVARVGKYKQYKKVIECLEDLVGDYSTTITKSLELATSYLYLKAIDASPHSKYHTGFIALLELLNSVLARTTNDLKLGRRSLVYRFLLDELKKLDNPSDLSIITFNYDLIIENALHEISVSRSDVFDFPKCYQLENHGKILGVSGEDHLEFVINRNKPAGVGLLKLHGSMNWRSQHTSHHPRPSALFRPDRSLHVINSRHVPWSLSWKPNQRSVYMKPIIIPPVSGKRGVMHESVMALWDIAAQKLRNANRVVIAGYSCPPLDIEARILLSENLRLNNDKKVYVIDPNPQTAAQFLDLCAVAHTTIYSSISRWLDDATSS